jgi:UDP-N-acetylmuramoylalanine--D-glutamate ligase
METLSLVGVGEVINDSKSTCWSATHAALRTSGPGTHLIAGGRSKAEDPIALKALLKQNRVSVYLIGECAEALAAVWSGAAAHCECCGTLEQAVERVWQRRDISQPLLFSPGCASFDQFESYAQRGEVFRQLVMQRAGKKPLPPNER